MCLVIIFISPRRKKNSGASKSISLFSEIPKEHVRSSGAGQIKNVREFMVILMISTKMKSRAD